MGWLSRRRPAAPNQIHVGDPRFDAWEVVTDFDQAEAAGAWAQHLSQAGFDVALTADWPLDDFGRGDIALRVPPEQWGDARDLAEGLAD